MTIGKKRQCIRLAAKQRTPNKCNSDAHSFDKAMLKLRLTKRNSVRSMPASFMPKRKGIEAGTAWPLNVIRNEASGLQTCVRLCDAMKSTTLAISVLVATIVGSPLAFSHHGEFEHLQGVGLVDPVSLCICLKNCMLASD